jgi:pilus assembly protein CpaB
MGAVRIAIIVVAGVAAIALAFLVQGMLSPKPAQQQVVAAAPATKPMAQVLVAKTDLPVGRRITASDVTWQAWPVEALNASYITNGSAPVPEPAGADKVVRKARQAADDVIGEGPIQALEGALVKEPLLANEPITARKVVRAGQTGYMAVVLQPGMRAVAISVTAETGAGGFILPGDRVDVLQARQPEGERKTVTTELLMRNLRVLAIDQATETPKDSKTAVGATATLEVPAADAEVLVRGKAQGQMVLALRSYADIGGPSGRGGMGAQNQETVRVVRAGVITEVSAP